MSGKARKASTHLSLSGTQLDGYTGYVDIITASRRLRWWERLLRRKRGPVRELAYVNVRGDQARAWKWRDRTPASSARSQEVGRP